jgi:ATP-binding cassette subfamily F protein uup
VLKFTGLNNKLSYIRVQDLSKTFHDRVILDNVSFSVEKGEKVALIAQNGTGKTTLLKILVGEEGYDRGLITSENGIHTAFLSQHPDLNLQNTIIQELLTSDSPMMKAVYRYEASLNTSNLKEQQEAYEDMNSTNGWEFEAKMHEVLEVLGLNDKEAKIENLSGGEKRKVAFAKILIDSPDFLILDEPTNHLDLEMIDWLENYFIEKDITLLLVTHDRYFLERVCNKILELDGGKIYKYDGNYSFYLNAKTIRETNHNINIEKTKALLKRELEWVRRGPSGRQTKADARVDAYYELKASLGKKIEVEKVKLDIKTERLGTKILEIYNLSKSFGSRKIVDKFSYKFKRGEKLGIVGPNGVGKTTFLNILMEKTDFDSGKIIKGLTVKFGYYTQEVSNVDENLKIIDYLKSIANFIKLSDGTEISASKMLERFLFSPSDQQTKINALSGGMKKRLKLLSVLMTNPNFLILDEPTNDFDILTINVLEEFLMNYDGCLIVISHDRYFLDKVTNSLLAFRGDGIISPFNGNYSEYKNSVKTQVHTNEVSIHDNFVKKETKSKDLKLANKLYKDISKLESKKKKLLDRIEELGSDFEKVIDVAKELKIVEGEIESLTEEWLEVS